VSRPRRRTPLEELGARNERIRTELIRGHRPATVARRYGISERQVRNVWKQRGEAAQAAERARVDARQAVQDEIEFLDVMLADCLERGEKTEHDGVWLGLMRTQLDIRRQRRELLSLYGLLPRGYEQVQLQERLGELIAAVVATLVRHKVPDAVLRDIDALRDAESTASEQELTPRLLPAKEAASRADEKH
jgi:hypothetical protein